MAKRLTWIVVLVVVIFAGAQLVRPDRTNPPTVASRTIEARLGASSGPVAVFYRGCGDCHSNQTRWPWFTEVAPLSWAMASGVQEGRKVLNFSDWAKYAPDEQRELLEASCRDASTGKMPPGVYTALRPQARLSARDIQTICAAAGQS